VTQPTNSWRKIPTDLEPFDAAVFRRICQDVKVDLPIPDPTYKPHLEVGQADTKTRDIVIYLDRLFAAAELQQDSQKLKMKVHRCLIRLERQGYIQTVSKPCSRHDSPVYGILLYENDVRTVNERLANSKVDENKEVNVCSRTVNERLANGNHQKVTENKEDAATIEPIELIDTKSSIEKGSKTVQNSSKAVPAKQPPLTKDDLKKSHKRLTGATLEMKKFKWDDLWKIINALLKDGETPKTVLATWELSIRSWMHSKLQPRPHIVTSFESDYARCLEKAKAMAADDSRQISNYEDSKPSNRAAEINNYLAAKKQEAARAAAEQQPEPEEPEEAEPQPEPEQQAAGLEDGNGHGNGASVTTSETPFNLKDIPGRAEVLRRLEERKQEEKEKLKSRRPAFKFDHNKPLATGTYGPRLM